MKVRSIRKHSNRHGPVFVKHPNRQYEVDDAEGARLIGLDLVEVVEDGGSNESKPDGD